MFHNIWTIRVLQINTIFRYEHYGRQEGHISGVSGKVCPDFPDKLYVLASSPVAQLHDRAAGTASDLCWNLLLCVDQYPLLDKT